MLMEALDLFLSKLLILKGGSSSVAERQLPKLNVAGSIPVSRSNTISGTGLSRDVALIPSVFDLV